ncbi:3230_t:CDS:2, partial [Racocetra fulgida]
TSRTEKITVDIGDDGFLNISEDETKGKKIYAPEFHYLLFGGYMLLPVEIIQEKELSLYSEDQESNFEILLECSSKGKGKHPNLNSEDQRRNADALGSTSNDYSEDRRIYADALGSTSNDYSEDQKMSIETTVSSKRNLDVDILS